MVIAGIIFNPYFLVYENNDKNKQKFYIMYCSDYSFFYFSEKSLEIIINNTWYKMSNGYIATMKKNGNKKDTLYLHQLICKKEYGDESATKSVDHINRNKLDNRIENLEWVTRKENVAHALAAGRRVYPEKRVRGINLQSKEIVTFESQIAAEKAIRGKQTGGVSGAMKRGRPAYGYVW